jgi:hypothetical protein
MKFASSSKRVLCFSHQLFMLQKQGEMVYLCKLIG